MIYKIKIWFFLFTLAIMASACTKDFLDVKPKGRIIAAAITDYNNLLEASDLVQISGMATAINTWHIMGDDVAGLEPHYSNASWFGTPGTRNQNLFEWTDNIYRPDEDTEEISVFYKRIYTVNKIIHEVMDANGGTEQQKKQYRAEALCQRAFAYFSLVNLFGKPYQQTSSAGDLGVPLVLKGDFAQKEFKRASVQEVYEQILSDLIQAVPDLPKVQNSSNRYTRAAAEALLGKVYLFMGRANDAVNLLDQAITDLPSNFTINGYVELIDYNTASISKAPLGYVYITPRVGSTSSQGHGYPETLQGQLAISMTWLGMSAALVISPETYALFNPGDLRLNMYFNSYGVIAPGPGPLLPAGLYRSRSGFLGSSMGVQLPDIYLLRAEAKARTNDLNGALENLLILRKKRMPEALAIAGIPVTKDELIKFIIEERRREFATLGYRWYDMRRLSVDPLFAGASYIHTLYNADGTIKATYKLRPERFILKFSDKLLSQSPGLINNL